MKPVRTIIAIFAFRYLLPQCSAQAKPRELPREILCVRDGFVVFNGMTLGFKRLSAKSFYFVEIPSRQSRTISAACYPAKTVMLHP